MNRWQYDEFTHCGVDYSKTAQSERYDGRHQRFRDYEKEFNSMMDFLAISDTKDKVVIDLGCGTGATAVFAARLFKAVYAVDVSDAMIKEASKKLDDDVRNVRFINAGFLSYKHDGAPADLVITKAALHHLPDFWKQIALLRMNKMLKKEGTLYLHDVIFQFDPRRYAEEIDAWITGFAEVAGEAFRAEVEAHIRDEFSTFGWIMNGMIERAGFVVEKVRSDDQFMAEYACRKIADLDIEENL